MEETKKNPEPLQAPPTRLVEESRLLMTVRPSLTLMLGKIIFGLVLMVCSVFLIFYPVESLSALQSVGKDILSAIAMARAPTGLAIIAIVVLWLIIKAIILKSTIYTISSERIERRKGVLTRTTDNLDFWRVNDVELRQTLTDRLCGIGSIFITSTDQTDPHFVLFKVSKPHEVYEIVRKAGMDSAKRAGVLRVESMTS